MKITLVNGCIEDQEVVDSVFWKLKTYFDNQNLNHVSYYSPISFFSFLTKLPERALEDFDLEINDGGIFISNNHQIFVYASFNKTEMEQALLNGEQKPLICFPNFQLEPPYSIVRERPQLIYNCQEIIDGLENDLEKRGTAFLSKRSRKNLAKNLRECVLHKIGEEHEMDLIRLMEHWGDFKTEKGLATNIQKDMALLPFIVNSTKYGIQSYIGYRGLDPVSISVFSLIEGEDIGIHHVAKSLNYASQPGGYNETSVWELYQTCKKCISHGITRINVSGYDNGSLKAHKEKFSVKSDSFQVYDWEISHQ